VPVRAGPVFAWISSGTVALPVPPVDAVGTVIHAALLTAAHGHSALVVIATVCVPAAAVALIVSGATAAVQPVSWVMVNV
jgi:hypothetical protein